MQFTHALPRQYVPTEMRAVNNQIDLDIPVAVRNT